MGENPFLGWSDPGTAVITGASSGLGRHFATELARRGFSLVLVARRKERLELLASELEVEHGALGEVIPADLTDEGDLGKLVTHLEGLGTVDVLVNNAGFGTRGSFSEVGLEKSLTMLKLHCSAPVRLVHAVLPPMLAKKRGVIINTSSQASLLLLKNHAMYNATKSFLRVFSESLQLDLMQAGIKVQALCPSYTMTEFHEVGDYADFDRSHYPVTWMSPEEVVETSLAALQGREVVVVPRLDNMKVVEAEVKRHARQWARRVKREEKKARDT